MRLLVIAALAVVSISADTAPALAQFGGKSMNGGKTGGFNTSQKQVGQMTQQNGGMQGCQKMGSMMQTPGMNAGFQNPYGQSFSQGALAAQQNALYQAQMYYMQQMMMQNAMQNAAAMQNLMRQGQSGTAQYLPSRVSK